MILYEVNLSVQSDVAAEYLEWLRDHVEQILRLDGFRSATLLAQEGAEDGTRCFTVHYWLADRASLDAYFANHAAAMRQDGLDRFGNRFTATRRVMSVLGE
ncbi:MAG TPA: DUF4286 family protein [Candidatus Kapabacteria bacterium]|nr:DUF4286 family protein [Candidatus Kapabacteria bacterium]